MDLATVFDWNHIAQLVCTLLAAYFGGKHGTNGGK